MVDRSRSRTGTSANQIISGKGAPYDSKQFTFLLILIAEIPPVLPLRYQWHKSVIEVLELVSGERCWFVLMSSSMKRET